MWLRGLYIELPAAMLGLCSLALGLSTSVACFIINRKACIFCPSGWQWM